MNTSKMSKIQLCLVTFGIIIGIIGILHGSAELYKGTIIVESQSVEALPENWPNAVFYSTMKGSPVFSCLTGIPFYVLGLVAIFVSITLIVFSTTFLRKAKLEVALVLFAILNIGVFLFGAGRGTPVAIGVPLIIFGILSILITKKKSRRESSKKIILSSFYFFYGLHIFSWVLFFPGLFVISFYQEIPTWLFLFDFMSMPVSVLGALIAGFLYDNTIQNKNEVGHV
jgi:hypothetical protein